MYKNLYVVGLAEVSLGIVSTQADFIARLQRLNCTRSRATRSIGRGIDDTDSVIDWLEAHSEPDWSAHKPVIALAKKCGATSIVDFGCGGGRLAGEVMASEVSTKYFGFDVDRQRIELARTRNAWAYFEYDIEKFVRRLKEDSGNGPSIVNFAFVLHDVGDLSSARTVIESLERPRILIQDLTSSDLPRLLGWLSQASGRMPDIFRERRMSFGRLSQIASALDITFDSLEIIRLAITFSDSDKVMNYCDQFELFEGWDMPVMPFSNPQYLRTSFMKVLETVTFPCVDTRTYVIAVAVK